MRARLAFHSDRLSWLCVYLSVLYIAEKMTDADLYEYMLCRNVSSTIFWSMAQGSLVPGPLFPSPMDYLASPISAIAQRTPTQGLQPDILKLARWLESVQTNSSESSFQQLSVPPSGRL